jgi:hypothetical protein
LSINEVWSAADNEKALKLKTGHEVGSNPSLWEGAVDELLKSLQ